MIAIIIIFALVAAVAFVVQMAILSALFRVMPALRMEGIIGRLQQQTNSIVDTTHTILEDAEPKINEITTNVAETKATVHSSLAQAVQTWDEITNLARAQAIRLRELISTIASKARGNDLGRDAHSRCDASVRSQTRSKGEGSLRATGTR